MNTFLLWFCFNKLFTFHFILVAQEIYLKDQANTRSRARRVRISFCTLFQTIYDYETFWIFIVLLTLCFADEYGLKFYFQVSFRRQRDWMWMLQAKSTASPCLNSTWIIYKFRKNHGENLVRLPGLFSPLSRLLFVIYVVVHDVVIFTSASSCEAWRSHCLLFCSSSWLPVRISDRDQDVDW